MKLSWDPAPWNWGPNDTHWGGTPSKTPEDPLALRTNRYPLGPKHHMKLLGTPGIGDQTISTRIGAPFKSPCAPGIGDQTLSTRVGTPLESPWDPLHLGSNDTHYGRNPLGNFLGPPANGTKRYALEPEPPWNLLGTPWNWGSKIQTRIGTPLDTPRGPLQPGNSFGCDPVSGEGSVTYGVCLRIYYMK